MRQAPSTRAPCRREGPERFGVARRARALIWLCAAAAVAVAACSADLASDGLPDEQPDAAGESRPSRRPIVQSVARPAPAPDPLDPAASPRTPLGVLRAAYLPIWVPEFDSAFPPQACGSAWELDAVAQPALNADMRVAGDLTVAAALGVMRYEFLRSRWLSRPEALGQLCLAVASVDPVRTELLDELASYLRTGLRLGSGAVLPSEVTTVGLSSTGALAVACVAPGYGEVLAADGTVAAAALAPARLAAYLLTAARGIEDEVADVTYRVSRVRQAPVDDCDGLGAWADRWAAQVQQWIAEGRVWVPQRAVVTVVGQCERPPADGPRDCPEDWPR